MSEAAYENQGIAGAQDDELISEMCNNVEPLSREDLALFAGLVTLPQAVAPQPAFDSLVQRHDAAYARPAFASSVQPNEPAFQNVSLRYQS